MTKCRRTNCILPLGGGGSGVGSGSCQHLSRLPERRLGGGMVPVVNLRPQQRTPHTPASHRVPNTNNTPALHCGLAWEGSRMTGCFYCEGESNTSVLLRKTVPLFIMARWCKSQISLRNKQQMCVHRHFCQNKEWLTALNSSGRDQGSRYLRFNLEFLNFFKHSTQI